MAYGAVASLLQTLDYLLKFSSLISKLKKLQVVAIRTKFQNYLRQLNIETETEPLDSAVDAFIRVLFDGQIEPFFNNKTTKLVEQKPQILERGLNKFLGTGFHHISLDIPNSVLQLCSRDAVEKLILACHKIKGDLTFFCEVSRETTDVCQYLRSFLIDLGDFSNKCDDHRQLQCIKDFTDRARDLVEESLVDNEIEAEMTHVIETLFGVSCVLRALEENAFEIVIKNVFNENEGIRQSLLMKLEEIQSVTALIQTIRGKTINMNDEMLNLESSTISPRDSNKEEIVVGFDDELIRILEGITRLPSGLEIVTVVGMAGIGKTTLAKKNFNHPYIAHHFYCRAWITISQVYQVRDLLLRLLSSVATRTDQITGKSNAQLAEDLYRSLKGQRYLIVLDDMWSIDAWSDVKRCFPNDKIGSRIIVTSRFTELAKCVSPNKAPHFINLLDTEKSWKLLEKLVFGIASCSPELVEVGKQIAKRCGGLPLAIVVIGGILSHTIRTLDSWKHVAEEVSSIVSSDPEQCLDVLALSYIYLPHQLRACFLYMGAFPEDCEIEAQKLINLWAAEGFLYSDCPKNLEQIGEEYLEGLIGRNLVLAEKRRFGGKVKTCRLHDFIRELCLREARKENFMTVVQRGGSKSYTAGMRNQRRLSFHLDPYSNDPTAPPLPRVSSFLCFSLGSDIVPDVLFFQLGFKLLRVLDIYFLRFEHFPEQVLMLIHLRYLALNVTFELPETMCQLRNLQTFVIQGPWLSRESGSSPTLLLKYWSMPSLRHLHCSAASHLRNPSIDKNDLPGTLAPEHLKTLSTIRFSSCKKEVFAIMPHLKRLGICETKDEYSTDRSCLLLNSLIFLQELETLNCCFYVQNREPRRLSCLYAFPSTLRHLSLSWSYLPWEDMTPIAMLPNLEVLKLKNYAFQGPKWLSKEEGFRSLKHLLIEKTNLVCWEAAVHQFSCLQNLFLKSCKHLEEIPFGVEGIGSLHRMELHYCSEPIEILAKEIQEQIEGIDVVIRSDRTPDSA